MTKDPQDIILAPIITERSMKAVQQRKYTFRVAKDANKIEIGKAVESLFPGTKVSDVNTMHVRGQLRRQGRNSGYTASWKKAIVKLSDSSRTIEFFDSMT